MRYWLALIACVFCAVAARAGEFPAPVQAMIRNGVAIQGGMQAPNGFKGYVGKYEGDLIPIYLMPDGKHVFVGTLYDARGNDLTQAAFHAATTAGLNPALWDQLGKSTWIAEGTAKPERVVYVFTDTECPFCHQLWLAAQSYLRQGKVQMRDVIVAVIAPASLGRGAAVLTAGDPAAMWRKHERAFGHSTIKPLASVDPHTRAEIEANKVLMDRLHVVGTPVVVYRDRNGAIREIQGIPDQAGMQSIFGN